MAALTRGGILPRFNGGNCNENQRDARRLPVCAVQVVCRCVIGVAGAPVTSRNGVLIVGFTLVVLSAVVGSQLWQLWQVRAGKFLRDGELEMARVAPAAATGLADMANAHLFGNVADKPPPEPEKPAALPVTDLKLVLVGAITDSDPSKASALISADNVVKRFYVGDDIHGQATLSEVAADSVVLKRVNRYEKLQFPKGGELNPEAREAIARLTGQKTEQAPPAAQAVPPPAQAAPSATAEKPKTTGRSLRDKLQRLPKNKQKPPGS